jgi:hypothetical protein
MVIHHGSRESRGLVPFVAAALVIGMAMPTMAADQSVPKARVGEPALGVAGPVVSAKAPATSLAAGRRVVKRAATPRWRVAMIQPRTSECWGCLRYNPIVHGIGY